MAIALRGNLSDFGIAEVFQLIGQQRKTGTLLVEGEARSIFLAFHEGCVVRGGPIGGKGEQDPVGPQLVRSGYLTREQLEDLRRESERSARPVADLLLQAGLVEEKTLVEVQVLLTKETVFDVMRRKSGDFNFVAETIHHDTAAENLLGAEQILMDGLRMLDEWQTFSALVPSEEVVFQRVVDLDGARSLPKTAPDRAAAMERVLPLIDGRLSVRRIIDLSRIGTFEATRALAELFQAGVLEQVQQAPSGKTKNAPKRRRKLPIGAMLRAAMATALPFALLGGLGFVATERAATGGGLPGLAIPMRAGDQLGDRFEIEQVRTAVDAHFFETGTYPAELAVLTDRLDSLTPERLAAYYYVVRDDEIVLLAPID